MENIMRPQHQLSAQQQRDLRWGSHIPLNTTILKVLPITGVLELGAGLNSTGLFFNNADYVTSVEADQQWIQTLREKGLEDTPKHKIVHHPLPEGIVRGTYRENIDPKLLKEAATFYKAQITDEMNYLFVDCYAGFRLEALLELHHLFDVIAYHDAEEKHDYEYGYSTFHANVDYRHFIDKTFLAHTGLLVTSRFDEYMPKFIETLNIESDKYAKRFDTTFQVNLVKRP